MALRETSREIPGSALTREFTTPDGGTGLRAAPGRSFASRRLHLMMLAMAFLLCAAAAWVVFGGPSGARAPEAVETLLDDYRVAWENKDIVALDATTTDAYVYSARMYAAGRDINNPDQVTLVRDVEHDLEYWRFRFGQSSYTSDYEIEQVGDLAISGNGPWFVAVEEIWSERDLRTRSAGVALFVIVDERGTLRIDKYDWAGLMGWEGLDG